MFFTAGSIIAFASNELFAAVQTDPAGISTMCTVMMLGNTMKNPGKSWEAPSAESVRKNPVQSDKNSIASGKTLFDKNCSSCHGANAKGSSSAPDLTNISVQNQTDGALFWKISQGKSLMPGFTKTLTPNKRWDAINFIRSLSAITPENTSASTSSDNSDKMMSPVMNSASMAACPDGGVIVLMGNELFKYDKDLNLVKQVEIKFDWENWQKMMIQYSVKMNSMGIMMSSIMVTIPDAIIVMMNNQLMKYDFSLNLVKQVETKFDLESRQK